MKKTLLLAGVACLMATQVHAFEPQPYIGLDMTYSDADVDSDKLGIDDSLYEHEFNSFVINAGAKFHPNFGAEVFYQQSGDEEGDTAYIGVPGYYLSDEIETSFKAYGADVMGYVPLGEKVEGLASLGLGNYEFKMKGFGLTEKDDGLSLRMGLGAQYNINNHVSIRGMARYVALDTDYVDSMTEVSVGAQYRF